MAKYKPKQYLTPDIPNSESPLIFKGFLLPSEPIELVSNLIGSMTVLYDENNWLEYGELTPEETAQYYRNLEIMTDLCDAIITTCFNQVGFQQALAQLLGDLGFGNGGGGTNEINSGASGLTVWSAGSCTDSDKFGVAFEMVATLDRQAKDMLEKLQDGTNEATTALDMVGNIPVVNIITSAFGDSASELASYIVNEIVLSYNAAYTEPLQDEIACRIFQKMEDCSLSMDMMIEAYEDFISDTLTLPSSRDMVDIVTWLFGLSSLIDNMIVATLHWLILQVYAHASTWFGNVARAFVIASAYAESVPPPEDCVEPSEIPEIVPSLNSEFCSEASTENYSCVYDSMADTWTITTEANGSFDQRFNVKDAYGRTIYLTEVISHSAGLSYRVYYNENTSQCKYDNSGYPINIPTPFLEFTWTLSGGQRTAVLRFSLTPSA